MNMLSSLRIFGLAIALGVVGAAHADQPAAPTLPFRAVDPPAAAPERATLEALSGDVAATQSTLGPPRATAGCRPAPASIEVKLGVNEIIPIARGHLNRFRTPFARPVIKTTSDVNPSGDGSVMYITTNSTRPVTLFVFDEDAPEQAMSLTLVPCDGAGSIPPADTLLTLEGVEPRAVVARQGSAADFERSLPYVDLIKQVFRHLALGEVPAGYGLSDVADGHPLMPNCYLPGLSVTPKQALEGNAIVVLVARVQNRAGTAVEIDESACAAPGVLAVAAWPYPRLESGQATELYVAVRRPEPGAVTRRPSVLRSH